MDKMVQQLKIPQRTTVEISTEAKMKKYESFLQYMNSNSYIKKPQGMICDMDSAYIQTFKVKSGTAGKIIELRCPPSQAISVFGKYQTVSLRCFDDSNREPEPVTRTNFRKVSRYGGISRKCRATYSDLSPVKAIKYSFAESLYLSGEEVLELEILNPDIDIERIELSMEADIFETFGHAC